MAAQQCIPDNDSKDADEYVRYPIETLVDGQGDCEDKVALLVALLYEMDADFVLLVLPEHMAVGVHLDEVDVGRYLWFHDKKYYFNKKFDGLPENVKEDLHVICVLFTEEVGGVFTIGFTPRGEVELDTQGDEGDLLYDEIGSALLVKKIRSTKRELLSGLSMYYRITFLHEDPSVVLAEEDDDEEEE